MKPVVRWILRSSERSSPRIRQHFAAKYLAGSGIEIGAGVRPLRVPKKRTQVRYVDVHPEDELVRLYGFNEKQLVHVDVVSEAEDLSFFHDDSLDFVVANHVLEHVLDPLTALKEWLRVVKPGTGVVFLTLPNSMANQFDFERDPPSISEIAKIAACEDKEERLMPLQRTLDEHARVVEGLSEPILGQRVDTMIREGFRPHFHVYDVRLAGQLVDLLREQGVSVHIKDLFSFPNSFEILMVLENSTHRDSVDRVSRNRTILATSWLLDSVSTAPRKIYRRVRRAFREAVA